MKPYKAFDLTLKTYKIRAVEISRKSGKAESFISNFRNGGKDVEAETLVELVKAMPDYAQSAFWGFCMSDADDIDPQPPGLSTKPKRKSTRAK
jgi:hypothetical protein